MTRVLALVLAVLIAAPALADCRPDQVELRGAGGTVRFTVELAQSPTERAQGLMYRVEMPRSAGMLFLYSQPGSVSFWMKNTLIPLDMVFADAAGRVVRVHSNAIPQDLTPIPGGDNVLAVLEINGGLAARLGIAAGSVMRHPAFNQATAAWPCGAP